MRDFAISSAKSGMNRQRNKGGAPKDSFYSLKECYVTSDRSVVPRPGTVRDVALPVGTKGLMAFRGRLWVFSSEPLTSPDPKYVISTLQHPDPASTANLKEIHFAQPFLGFPYVVAEFDDDPTKFYHYWLQDTGTWLPNHIYAIGEVVQPTSPNGYTYTATRLGAANPVWAAGQPRAIGDVIEPTVANGYQYRVIDVAGDNPVSGSIEPAWIAQDGAIVYEDNDTTGTSSGSAAPTVPPSVSDRYSNQGGSGGAMTNSNTTQAN